MTYAGFGYETLPTTDLSIAAGRQYTFKFSSWSSKSTIQDQIPNLTAYASGISVSTSGLTTVEVTLTPIYTMPLSGWQSVFSSIGLDDMTDLTVGTWTTTSDTGFNPVKNISTYWEPKIKAAAKAATSSFDEFINWLKTAGMYVAVGGVGLMALYAYMKGRGARPSYNSNPKRKKHKK